MLAIPLFMLLLSKTNCVQMTTNPQRAGILQAPYQESFLKQETLPSSPIPFALDNSPLPNIQAQQFARSESSSQLSPKEILANLRSRLYSPHSSFASPNTPDFDVSTGSFKRVFGQPYPSTPSLNPQLMTSSGTNSLARGVGIPNSQVSSGNIPPQFSPLGAESMFPSEQKYKNLPEPAFKNPQPGNTAETQTFRTNSFNQNSNFIPTNSQSRLDPISTGQAALEPFLSSLTASIPSPVVPSKPPRSTIPSPLSLMDSGPTYSYDVPAHTFGTSERILTSPVGCLELTVTPYGTISETPLPDPSTPLPRGPFLPIASPVSALAPPFSPLLPSAMPNAKSSSFLTKVPVPPPFI